GHAAGKAGDRDRGQTAGRRPVPELAVAVEAPALDPARARERATVITVGGDRAHAARKAGDGDRGVAAGCRPVPELAARVTTPALDPARARERATLSAGGGDRDHAAGKAGDGDRGQPVGRRSIPELAVLVPAPALDRARAREQTGVIAAGRD